jgi:large subunit ribosomal protein L28
MLTFEPLVKACLAFPRGLPQEGSPLMASVCDICGKKPSFGMNVSHSHRRTKRRWNPNVQRVRALVDGAPKRLHVCTSCIRAGKVTKPGRRHFEPSATN